MSICTLCICLLRTPRICSRQRAAPTAVRSCSVTVLQPHARGSTSVALTETSSDCSQTKDIHIYIYIHISTYIYIYRYTYKYLCSTFKNLTRPILWHHDDPMINENDHIYIYIKMIAASDLTPTNVRITNIFKNNLNKPKQNLILCCGGLF